MFCSGNFYRILFHPEPVDDKILSFRRVLAHIEGKYISQVILLFQANRLQPDIGTYKMLEFIRRDLPEPFEAGDLRIFPQFFNCTAFLPIGITIMGFLKETL